MTDSGNQLKSDKAVGTFITDIKVDIEKTLPMYLSQMCSQYFDMLKRDISGLLGGLR